jgi:hypothetical protein
VETTGPYEDYMDTHGGQDSPLHFTRDTGEYHDDEYTEADETAERLEALRRLQMPLPRIDMNY